MIRNRKLVDEFERALSAAQPADFESSMAIVEALYEEACALGIFPLKDPLDGIDVDVRLAWAVNHVSTPS